MVRNLGASGLNLPRRDDKVHFRPTIVDFSSKLQAVTAGRHLDVCEEQSDVLSVFHHFYCFFGIVRFNDGVTVLLKKIGCKETKKLTVLSYENGRTVGVCVLGHLC